MLIGIFVVAACAIVIFLLMFLHPSVGDQGRLLRVRFADIDKISIGTRVNFAGKPVGEVIEIRELPDIETERKAINGSIYVYELTLRVDSSINVFNTDEIASRTSGLLGEKSVAITPGEAKPGETIHLVNDEVIYATETGSVEDTLKQLKTLADKLGTGMDSLNVALTTMQEEKFWDNLSGTAKNINDITRALNKPDLLSQSISNVHKITTNVNKFSEDLNNSWPKVDKSLDNIADATAGARSITETINKGKGTVGRLVESDDLYLRLQSVLGKADTTMNDINHYGVLFQMDKNWQRLRARRLNLLQKLQTPQEFRNYFNDELDQISTSLNRVSMALGNYEMRIPYGCTNLLNDPQYTKVFSDLLRRISTLEEEVRMYNGNVIDNANNECQTEYVDCYDCN